MIRFQTRKINRNFKRKDEMPNQEKNFLIIKRTKLKRNWRSINNNCNKIQSIQKSLRQNRNEENRNLHIKKNRRLRPFRKLIKWKMTFKETSTMTSKRQEVFTKRERRRIGTQESNVESNMKKLLESEKQWVLSMHIKDHRNYTQVNSLVSQLMWIEVLSLIKICHFLYS